MDIKSHLITLDIIFLEFLCFSDDVEIIFCFILNVVRREEESDGSFEVFLCELMSFDPPSFDPLLMLNILISPTLILPS